MPAPSFDEALLPAPDDVMRCAPHSRDHTYDPGGTAFAADVIVVVDLPPPWPKPVLDHPWLEGLSHDTPSPGARVRILAAVPALGGPRAVRRFDRTPDGAFLTTHEATDGTALVSQIRATLATAQPSAAAKPLYDPTVLVCTQGTHDVCCGIEGTRLAMDLDSNPEVDVLRVSHTGGHRFAPTAMTLPDGRMWAGLDGSTVRAICTRAVPADAVVHQCRGWWGAAPGAAQVAERAVFAEVGWEWDQMVRRVDHVADDGPTSTWGVAGNGRTWQVVTSPSRTVPVLSCRTPGGVPAKAATEYTATITHRP